MTMIGKGSIRVFIFRSFARGLTLHWCTPFTHSSRLSRISHLLRLAPVYTQNAEGYSMKTKMAEELEERLSDEDNNRQVLSIPFVSFREDFFCKFAFV